MTNSPYKCKVKPAFLSFFSAQYSIILMLKIHFYHPPTKLGGSNVFTGVCLSTGGGGWPGGYLWSHVLSRGWVSLVPGPFRGYPLYQVPWGWLCLFSGPYQEVGMSRGMGVCGMTGGGGYVRGGMSFYVQGRGYV